MKFSFRFFKGLKGKIQLVFVVSFLLTLIVLSFILFFTIKPDLIAKTYRELETVTDMASSTLTDSVNSSVENHLVLLADTVRNFAEFEYKKYTEGLQTERQAYSSLSEFILDPVYGKVGDTGYLTGITGEGILEIHPKSPGVDASGYDFMKKAVEMKNGYIEYEWANVGEDVPRLKAGGMAYFKPWDLLIWASSYKTEFSSLVNKEQIFKTLSEISVGEKGYIWLTDKRGRILYHPDIKSGTEYSSIIIDSDVRAFGMMFDSALQKPGEVRQGLISYSTGNSYSEGQMQIVCEYIEDLDWMVFTQVPLIESISVLNRILIVLALLTLVCILLINIVVNIIFTRMLAPVSKVKEVSKLVSEGNLSLRIDVKSRDEIGDMAQQFNTVIENFSAMLVKVRKTSSVLLDSVQELSVSSQEISSTSNEQAAAVKEIVSTMEDSDQLSKNIAVKIEEVTRVSTNTKDVVNDGFSIIKETLSKMDDIRQANTGTISGIKMLGEKIESIWDIVNIINGIADQTKIIAFNAELEASAAGEAGKNFQIVATEIRRLADSTVSSTNEIKTKINEIQHSSDRLIISSEEGTSKITEGWELSNRLNKLFNDVLSSSEISATSAEHILMSIKQQVQAFEQILLTLKQISEGIDNFVVSTRATTAASQNLKEQADTLSETVAEYRVREGI